MAATERTVEVEFVRDIVPDELPDASYLEQEGWEDRLEAYQAGEFGFVGIQAVAKIRIPYGKDWILNEVRSPGLWGIEDDSGEDYFESVYEEELNVLRDMLKSLKEIKV